MIEETRTWWCDACGREIDGYKYGHKLIEFDDDGYAESVGFDFCRECTESFMDWKRQRRATNPNKSYIDRYARG